MALKVVFAPHQPSGQTEKDFAQHVLDLLDRVRNIKHEVINESREDNVGPSRLKSIILCQAESQQQYRLTAPPTSVPS